MDQGKTRLDLYLAHRAALIDYAAPIVGRATAEDVVQEAFIRFSALGDTDRAGRPFANPLNYLYRIVRNLAIDWTRRHAAEAPLPEAEELDALAASVPSAEQAIVSQDELRALARALAELPERTRVAFEMVQLEGRPLKEVAERLGISVVRAHQLVREAVMHGARRLDRTGR